MPFLSSLFSSKSSSKAPPRKTSITSTPYSKKTAQKPAPQAQPKKALSLQNTEKDGKRYKSTRPKNTQPVGSLWMYDKPNPRTSALDRKYGGEAGTSRGRATMPPLRAEYRKP